MSTGRTIMLVFLGIVLGVGLVVGTLYGIKEYSPQLASQYLASFLDKEASAGVVSGVDATTVRAIVQEVLTSDQAKAVIWDIMQGQTQETFDAMLETALQSPEFRKALADALVSYLETPEGKAVVRKIVNEAMTP